MSDLISAVNASPRREAAEIALPVPKNLVQAERVREAARVQDTEREKEIERTTAAALSSAVADINHSLKMASIGVQFEFDREAKTMITKVIDVDSGELIRQMPSEEVVRISKVLGQLQGFLLSQKV